MTLGLRSCHVLVGALAFAACVPAAPAGTDAAAASAEIVRDILRREPIPGMAVAVIVDGRLVWSEGFGYSNLELEVPVTPRTRFRIGSISMPLTMAAVGRLYEAGAIDLEAPIGRYLPLLSEDKRPITVRQLAAHRGGIDSPAAGGALNAIRYPDATAAAARIVGQPVRYPPGEQFLQSSQGYTLLGAIVEAVSRKPFIAYVRDSVTRPLKIDSVVPDSHADILEDRAAFYVYDENGQIRNAPYVDNSDVLPGGGFLSCAEDLARFGDAIVNGGFLSPHTRDLMLAPDARSAAEGISYGLGWNTSVKDGITVVGHGGGQVGTKSWFGAYRDTGLVIAVLMNVSPSPDKEDVEPRMRALQQRMRESLYPAYERIAMNFLGQYVRKPGP
jgi:serine beta-lactamase-like protein LACTB